MATALALPARGKAAKLVDERSLPAHLRCSSCEQPVYNSFQSPHGCRMCHTCVEALPPQEKVRCPGKTEACRDKEENTDISQASCFPDMASRREIGKLRVFCPNKQDGCNDQFVWRDVEAHLNVCEFEKADCNLCGDRKLKKELAEHQRNHCRQRRVECSSCHAQIVAGLMDTEHRNLQSATCCPSFTGPCPHCSEGQLQRSGYLQHLTECRQKPTVCRFAHLGCDMVDEASRLEVHYRDALDKHVEMVDRKLQLFAAEAVATAEQERLMDDMDALVSMKQQISLQLMAQITSILKRVAALFLGDLTWPIPDCEQRRQEAMQSGRYGMSLFSPPFTCGPFKFRARMYLDGWGVLAYRSHVSVYLVLIEGPLPGSSWWPFKGKATFTLTGPTGGAKWARQVKIRTRNRRLTGPTDLSLQWGDSLYLPLVHLRDFVHADNRLVMLVQVASKL